MTVKDLEFNLHTEKTKTRLLKGILKRELKDKYRIGSSDEDKIVNECRACGGIATIENGVLIQNHYRRCPTAQLERILSL